MARVLAGRYELEEKIGEGGMAVVFRSRDLLLGRNVAVKILRPEYTKDQMFIESFRKESQLAASIVDPNIVNVYDVGKEGNVYYIVMELVEGEPLSEIIKREAPLDPKRAAYITRQIAMALSTAHKHNLIHRDVKPHNVLVSEGDIAKISDFGIAIKATPENADSEEKKESVMGSIHYFSPEQARGAYVDERSDIYSLGIVLYEMLTGKVPFDGDNAVEVALKHMNEPMVPPSRLNPDIPQDLEDIVMKATSKLQTSRYTSADQMIMDLNFVKYSRKSDYSRGVVPEASNEESDAPGETQEEREARLTAEKAEEDRKQKKKILFMTLIILAVSALLIIGINILSNLKGGGNSDGTIRAPKVVGMTYERAQEYLKDFDLKIEKDMELPSSQPVGTILSQTPQEDMTIKPGQTIRVNTSRGGGGSQNVPNVVGQSQNAAKRLLESYGYVLGGVREEYSSTVSKGMIISQDPVAQSPLDTGSAVNLVVSLGPDESSGGEKVTVPKLVQLSLENATKALEEMGLVVGDIVEEESTTIQKDYIISQNVPPGSEAAKGTKVSLVVSTGAPDLQEKTITLELDYSKAEQDEFEVSVVLKDGEEASVSIINAESKSKSDSKENIEIKGKSTAAKIVVYFTYYDAEGKPRVVTVQDSTINFQTGDIVN